MFRIFNKTISTSKSVLYALTKIYGINTYQSLQICKNLGINPKIGLKKLKKNLVNRLIIYINRNLKVEEFLKQRVADRLAELVTIKTKRGIRQKYGLPVRGQRTHTNAKTIKRLNNIPIRKRGPRNKRTFKPRKKKKKKNIIK